MAGLSGGLPHALPSPELTVRTGTAAALSLPLSRPASAGLGSRRGGGPARALGLLSGPGVGASLKQTANGYAGIRVIPLTRLTANGQTIKRSYALTRLLSLTTSGVGGKQGRGPGDARSLDLARGRPAGRGSQWTLTSPTEATYHVMQPGTRLISTTPYGLTVYRLAGQWHTAFAPNPDRLAAADRIYLGGYHHPLDPDDRDELLAAGFAPYVTLKEIP